MQTSVQMVHLFKLNFQLKHGVTGQCIDKTSIPWDPSIQMGLGFRV